MIHVLKHLPLTAVLLAAGCMENATLLTVKPDGSGTILVREFYSPEMTSMFSGMGGMMGGMVEGMGEAMGAEMGEGAGGPAAAMPKMDFAEMLKAGAEKKVAQFGSGVDLVGTKEIENKKGWKGQQASYSFADITQVSLSIGGTDLEGGGMSSSSSDNNPEYTFRFTPGDVATLEIVPVPGEDDEPPATADEEEDNVAVLDAEEAMGAGMSQMMGPMLSGMRMSFFVKIDGEVVDTNAEFHSTDRPGVITVVDMPVDKMVGNAEAMKIMSSQAPDTMAQLRALDIPGLKLEAEDKTITVKFK